MEVITQTKTKASNPKITVEAARERIFNTVVFKVDDKMVEVEALRTQAAADDAKYGAPGRNAMRASMSKVYALYTEVQANPSSNAIKDRMVHLLEQQNVTFRSNSKPASVFIRYVFRDLSDKQVHVYATALEVAEKKVVAPAAFLSMVDLAGGWEGVRAEAAAPDTADKPQLAVNLIKSAAAVETINAGTWSADETMRVYVAVNNDDGTASLKDLRLNEANMKAVFATYLRDIEQRNKTASAPKRILDDDTKAALFNLKADLSYQEQMMSEYHSTWMLESVKDLTKAEEARVLHKTAQFRAKGIKVAIRAIEKPKKEAATA